MNLIELNEIEYIGLNSKRDRICFQLVELFSEFTRKDLGSNLTRQINLELMLLNSSTLSNSELKILFKQKQTIILRLVEKVHKVIAKSHYRKYRMFLGMYSFGLPTCVAFGIIMGNIVLWC